MLGAVTGMGRIVKEFCRESKPVQGIEKVRWKEGGRWFAARGVSDKAASCRFVMRNCSIQQDYEKLTSSTSPISLNSLEHVSSRCQGT